MLREVDGNENMQGEKCVSQHLCDQTMSAVYLEATHSVRSAGHSERMYVELFAGDIHDPTDLAWSPGNF